MTIGSRPAGSADVERVTECLALAFATDPVWGVALAGADGGTDHHPPYWRLFVEGALRYGTVSITSGGEAVAVWIPPGGSELSDAQQAALERLIDSSLSPSRAGAIRELFGRFEASRAGRAEHAYLSLLATHPAHRGAGIGQALLAADLVRWDAAGLPTYLESTNPGNNHRYKRAGYREVGGFSAVLDDAWITAMWRPIRAGT